MMQSNRVSYLLSLSFLFAAGAGSCLANTITPTVMGVSVQVILERTLSFLLRMAGGIALLFLIASGIFYMMSLGNPEGVKKAKGMIIAALEGIFIILCSYVLLAFIDSMLT